MRGLLVLLAVLVLAGCATSAVAPRPAAISHIVLIKLDDPSRADELVADCDRLLATIHSVVSYAAGKHVEAGRGTVLNDYDVAIYVGYGTMAGYAEYVEHPQHVELVQKWGPVSQITVRDFLDPTP
ncbi:MAG: Dabb family protein [Planctomycetota bacterium]